MTRLLLAMARPSFTPRSIPGLALWLDAADGMSLFQNSDGTVPAVNVGDPVGYWGDKSGNGRHATQATGANRPTISATTVQSRKAIGFNGTSSRLALPSMDSTPSTVIAVARHNSGTSSSSRTPLCVIDGANYMSWQFQQTGAVRAGVTYNASQNHFTASGIDPQGAVLLMTGQMSSGGGGLIGRVNGAGLPFAEAIAYPDGGQSRIGCRFRNADDQFWSGEVCELVHYQSVLSLDQVRRVERYLASKWGITLAPQVANADAQDWINRVYANGGTVSATTASAVNTFCNDIDSAGIRGRFYRMGIFAGSNLAAALVPLYRGPSFGGTTFGNATDTNVNFVAGDYAETGASGGLVGDASTRYLNTGFRTQDLPGVNDCHIAVWSREANVDATRRAIGALGGTSDIYLIDRRTTAGGGSQARLGGGSNLGTGEADASAQSMIASRTSSTSAVLYKNATSIVTQTTPLSGVTLSTQVFGVFTGLTSGTTPSGFFPHLLCGYSIGAGLTQSQASAFHNAWAAFQTTLGRGL